MKKILSRRIDNIERRLKPEKGEWLKWPCEDGTFIEVPGCRTLLDVIARVGIGRNEAEVDESERE